MKILLTNNFHNTEVTLVPKKGKLSKHQIKRAKKTLCGEEGCGCSGYLGTRGIQKDIVATFSLSSKGKLQCAYISRTNIFGRMNKDGTVRVLDYKEGNVITSIPEATTVYPVGASTSCVYEHAEGINLSVEDAEFLCLEIEK